MISFKKHSPLIGLGNKHDLFNEPILAQLAKKYKKTVAQIALNWLLDRNIAVIPKATKLENLQQNFEIDDFSMSLEEIEQINALNKSLPSFDPLAKPATFYNIPLFD